MTPDLIRAVGVVGAGHSGTTIVYRMLALHPDATWLSQYSRQALFGPPILRGAALRVDLLLRRVFPHDWRKVQYAGGWRRIVPTPIEASGIWDFVMQEDGGPAAALARLRTVFAAVSAAFGRGPVIVKPPGRYRSRCAPVISTAFPQSRYLHVARDGRAVALSVSQKYLKGAPHQRESILRRGADHWIRALRQIQEYEHTLPVAVVRYEALCADVHGEVRRALEFAGLDPERFPFDRCPRTLRSTNDARLRRAAPGEVAELDQLLKDDLGRLGYAAGGA